VVRIRWKLLRSVRRNGLLSLTLNLKEKNSFCDPHEWWCVGLVTCPCKEGQCQTLLQKRCDNQVSAQAVLSSTWWTKLWRNPPLFHLIVTAPPPPWKKTSSFGEEESTPQFGARPPYGDKPWQRPKPATENKPFPPPPASSNEDPPWKKPTFPPKPDTKVKWTLLF